MHDRAGDGRPLCFATRKLLRKVPQPRRQPDPFTDRRGPARDLRLGVSRQQEREAYVLGHRERREQIEELEDEAHTVSPDPCQLIVVE